MLQEWINSAFLFEFKQKLKSTHLYSVFLQWVKYRNMWFLWSFQWLVELVYFQWVISKCMNDYEMCKCDGCRFNEPSKIWSLMLGRVRCDHSGRKLWHLLPVQNFTSTQDYLLHDTQNECAVLTGWSVENCYSTLNFSLC